MNKPTQTFPEKPETRPAQGLAARLAAHLIVAGFVLYAAFAPHSIAGSWIGLSVVTLGLAAQTLLTGRTKITHTALDYPLWLFIAWTILSIAFSAEPQMSLAKLPSVSIFLVFYLAQATLTRRMAVALAALMIASGVAGVLWGAGEVVIGRGVVIEEIAPDSALRREVPLLKAGDAIWRVGERRVASVAEIDEALRVTTTGTRPKLYVIANGEHVVWDGATVTEETKRDAASPSGLKGGARTHRFRASGWTRHYETFAEILQMLAQLALGFALAGVRRGQTRGVRVWLPAAAFALLAIGIALTAMRTALVAFAVGAFVVAWRASTRTRTRVMVALAVVVVLALGAFAVSRTRAGGALRLQDASSSMRFQIALAAVARTSQHPLVGHGMDAVNLHWQEWGFPGDEKAHTHSTWVQLAFDRGIPTLLFWLWLAGAFWALAARAEKFWRTAPDDAGAHGLALGTTGALAGFLASSLVNYNFGDAEVALLFWWLMGAVVVLARESEG